jgi:hypothetical protein
MLLHRRNHISLEDLAISKARKIDPLDPFDKSIRTVITTDLTPSFMTVDPSSFLMINP